MTRLKGSGIGGKYSFEASPLVKDGIMYVVTGNDDVFALNAKTGEIIWEYWSGIDQSISTVCCGWVNRGLAMGEGQIYLGQLDANVVALDMKTGKVAWKTPIEKWQNGYGVTSAPLYYDGVIYSGITGGEFGVRGRLTALNAKTGEIMWRWFTLPGPGEKGSETWPPGTDHSMRGGAAIWNTPASILNSACLLRGRQLRAGYDGSMREGDNLFCTSIVALKVKTGEYAWHFQQVHHDLWDYDAASPVVLFDTVINGEPRKGIAEAGRTGWVYILDRTNGKPLIGIDEKPVPQEPRQKTAATQPIPVGDAIVPQCAEKIAGYDEAGCIYTPFWESPVLVQPSGIGGVNWSPMPWPVRIRLFLRAGYGAHQRVHTLQQPVQQWGALHRRRTGRADRLDHERHLHRDRRQDQQDRLAAQDAVPRRRRRRLDRHGGWTGAARRTGRQFPGAGCQDRQGTVPLPDRIWRGRSACVYEVDGDVHHTPPAAIRCRGVPRRCGLTFSLKGSSARCGAAGADGGRARPDRSGRRKCDRDRCQYTGTACSGPHRIKGGTTVSFTNVGDLPHDASALQQNS